MPEFTAGCAAFDVPGLSASSPISTVFLYPSLEAEREEFFGPYPFPVARNAAPAPGTFPLVIVSHGTGGSGIVYRSLARHLASRGFAVALPEHPGNNRRDNSLAYTAAILALRPRHISRLLDWLLADPVFSPILQSGSVAVIGHSLGGYTALALAGARATAFGNETLSGLPEPVDTPADPRVKALVLLAPATAWFQSPGALAAVRLPVFMLSAELDPHTPAWHADLVRNGLPGPALLEHHVVAGAGHFSFLTPFPAEMTTPAFPPSQDPPGFDRAAFHERLNRDVEAFLRRALPAA